MLSAATSSALKQKWSDSGLFALVPPSSLAFSRYFTWTASTHVPGIVRPAGAGPHPTPPCERRHTALVPARANTPDPAADAPKRARKEWQAHTSTGLRRQDQLSTG